MSWRWSVSLLLSILSIVLITLCFIMSSISALILRTKKVMEKVGKFHLSTAIRLLLVSFVVSSIAGFIGCMGIVIGMMGAVKTRLGLKESLIGLGLAIVLFPILSTFLANKIENHSLRNKGNKGLTFRDKRANLYTFEAVGNKTRMTVMNTEGSILSTEHIDPKLLKTLRVASRADDMAFAYALTKMPEDSIQNVSKIQLPKEDHLIMQLLKKKDRENLITYLTLLSALVGEIVFFIRYQEISILLAMLLSSLLLLFSYINQHILKYRVECGLYGTCAAEAKEIIAFILKWREKNSDSDSGLPKLVFKEEELLERVLSTDGGEKYAG